MWLFGDKESQTGLKRENQATVDEKLLTVALISDWGKNFFKKLFAENHHRHSKCCCSRNLDHQKQPSLPFWIANLSVV